MTTATLRTKTIQTQKTSVAFLEMPRIQWKAVFWIGVVLAFALVIFYLFEINELTSGAYVIKQYNNEISQLSNQNSTLQEQFAEASFLGSIQDKVTQMGFEETTDMQYMQTQTAGDSLAKAN